MTARGSRQLSYWAASTRNTKITARKKKYIAEFPAWSCKKARSVHSVAIDRGSSLSAISCIRETAWPELVPGAASALTAADEYML